MPFVVCGAPSPVEQKKKGGSWAIIAELGIAHPRNRNELSQIVYPKFASTKSRAELAALWLGLQINFVGKV